MLDTRYTPNGKRKRRKPNWRQVVTVCLCVGFVAAFLTFGLQFMLMSEVVAAPVATPSPTPSAASLPTPTPTPSATPAAAQSASATATATPTPTPTPTPSPTPVGVILTEDAENGVWLYETESIRIDITRQHPLEDVTATVAVVTQKNDTPVLRTAFAEGAYGKNVRARTRDIAASVGAVFAVNGDYCGYRDDGIIVREGVLYRANPVREALCLFSDGQLRVIREADADANALLAEGLTDSWSFGPILVENGQLPETFSSTVKGNNPRTALGQRADGSYVFVVVDGRSEVSIGMTIEELAQYLYDLGCVTAYNLDGGMTSCMYFNGSVISTPCGTANKERSLSDIIYILP